MGGGAAMRAASKVAGVGVINSGIRSGFSAVPPPAEQSVRNASRPVSAILSSSQNGKAGVVDIEGVQRPAWEIDDWEFAGFEEEKLLESTEHMPRVVFGPAPTLQEAKEAASDVKYALENVCKSSSACKGPDGSFGGGPGGQLSSLSLLINSQHLETKSCINFDGRASSAPKHAVQAFALLNESPTQRVITSIASDPNVWDAVLKNEDLQKLLQSQKTKSGADVDFQELESSRGSTEISDDTSKAENSESSPMNILENIKHTVVDMVNNVSNFVQHIFGVSAEDSSAAAEENAQPSFINKTMVTSLMAAALMVIAVVVLKRQR